MVPALQSLQSNEAVRNNTHPTIVQSNNTYNNKGRNGNLYKREVSQGKAEF